MALLRLGFTVEDMRRMTIADFIAYTDLAFGEQPKQDGVRDATQEEIDRLLG